MVDQEIYKAEMLMHRQGYNPDGPPTSRVEFAEKSDTTGFIEEGYWMSLERYQQFEGEPETILVTVTTDLTGTIPEPDGTS